MVIKMQLKTRIVTIRDWFLNLPLISKMFILFALAGLIPLSVSFIVSYKEIYQFSINNQKNMSNQAYIQTLTTLTDKFARIKKLSAMISTSSNLNKSLKVIKESKDPIEQYREYISINENLNNIYYSTEYDSITYYVNSDFDVTRNMLPLFGFLGTEQGREIKSRLSGSRSNVVWMPYKQSNSLDSVPYLSLVRYVVDLSNQEQYIAIMVVNVDLSKVRDTLVPSNPNQLLYLKTKEGDALISNNEQKFMDLQLTPEIAKRIGSNFSEILINGKKYLACNRAIPDTNLELVSMVPVESLNGFMFYSDDRIIIFYLCICALMLLIIYTIAKSISKRILLLSNKMKGVKHGELEKLNVKEQKDEVGDLVTNYNYMVDEIHSLLHQQFELGQEKKGAELKALQSQINPHFLYNTLDMINWMAQRNESENIRDTVFALSQYYRLILNKGQDIVTIGDELQLCNAYIAIQQKRFKDKIQFKVDVDEKIMMYLIPKITLQPLIENAIIHGIIESSSGRGTIIVSGWEDGDNLILAVTDDGIGMEKQEGIGVKHSGSGYGISNIEMRLTLFYGMTQCIQYESNREYGTCVSLNIRKITKKN